MTGVRCQESDGVGSQRTRHLWLSKNTCAGSIITLTSISRFAALIRDQDSPIEGQVNESGCAVTLLGTGRTPGLLMSVRVPSGIAGAD